MLSDKLKELITGESVMAHANHMTSIKANIANSNSIVRHTIARQLDEPSPAEARAIDKILRLPK